MKTLILAIATAALLSVTMFGTTAEAGGLRRHNFHKHNHFAALRRAEIAEARRTKLVAARKAKIRRARIAAAKRAKIAQIRKAKIAAAKRAKFAQIKKAKFAKQQRIAAQKRRSAAKEMLVAEAETNTADVSSDDKFEEKIVVAEADTDRVLDCKKFIPSAGMTISVPCQD